MKECICVCSCVCACASPLTVPAAWLGVVLCADECTLDLGDCVCVCVRARA